MSKQALKKPPVKKADYRKYLAEREEADKQLSQIITMKDTGERWKAIRGFMWRINEETYIEDRKHCEDLREEIAMSLITNPQQKSESGRLQRLISIPEYLYHALKLADPRFAELSSSKDRKDVQKLYYKVWKVFPEYRVAQKIRKVDTRGV